MRARGPGCRARDGVAEAPFLRLSGAPRMRLSGIIPDVQDAPLERAEDPLVSLAGERPGARLSQGGTWPGGCLAEEIVQARAGDQEEAVGRSGAGHREAAESGVELVEMIGPREGVDPDCDPVGLPLP